MSNTNTIVLTRDKVKRPWAEPEPKIFVAGVVGFVCLFAVILAPKFGISLPVEIREAIPVCLAVLLGYLTSSVGTVITNTDSGVTESHSGNAVVSVSTASVPVQEPTVVQSSEKLSIRDLVNNMPRDEQATQVLPPSFGGSIDDH